jgi:protein gp37
LWLLDALRVMSKTPHIDWVLITERPRDMPTTVRRASQLINPETELELLEWTRLWLDGGRAPANVWLGAHATCQRAIGERLPELAVLPAVRRLLMLSPLRDQAQLASTPGFAQLHWLILAGDTGPRAQPLHPVWARAVRDDCRQLGVPFFFESWGDWMPRTERMASGNTCELADPRLTRWTCQEISSDNLTGRDLRHASGERVYMQRVGQVDSGHWLDRTQWRQEPAPLDEQAEAGSVG